MAKRVLDKIYKACVKSEKELYKLIDEVQTDIMRSGVNNNVSTHLYFPQYETNDMFGKPRPIKKNGHKVWVFDRWVNSNVIPENKKAEVRDNRYPVRNVALWYTPFAYNTEANRKQMKYTPTEFYKEAEKEKVLYEDNDIKVVLLRRNVIPYFHSCQWTHQMADHEYVMYLKREILTEKQTKEINELRKEIHENNKAHNDGNTDALKLNKPLIDKIAKIRKRATKEFEVFHNTKLKDLFRTANRYFNDWYEY